MNNDEWTTKDKTVFGRWRTYSGIKRTSPEFKYGTAPKGYDENYYIEHRGDKYYAVVQEFLGYTSVINGHVPSRKEFRFFGTLRECKKWLIDLINKCYAEQNL